MVIITISIIINIVNTNINNIKQYLISSLTHYLAATTYTTYINSH